MPMPVVSQTEILDLNAALRSTSHRARVLTGATGVAIALAHKQSMICRASVGPNAPALGCRLDVTTGFSGECVRSGKALRCDDSEHDPRVDLTSCRRLGIRSILAVPILLEREVVGILETFSPQPYAFNNGHVAIVRALADSVFLTPPALRPAALPNLRVETEPAHKVFPRNLVEVPLSPEAAPAGLMSPPAQFWSDVFVSSRLPWERFGQSLVLHLAMVAAVWSFLTFAVPRTRAVYPALNTSDVLYYLPSEYLGTGKGKALSAIAKRKRTELAKQPFSVPREQRSRTQAMIKPPAIRLKREIRVLHMSDWVSVTPTVPASAVTQPQFIMPVARVDVIAPPPDISAVARSRALIAPPATVIEPPPSVHASSRHIHSISIGPMEVVSPAPQIPAHEQNAIFATVQASLRSELAAVVVPPPSINGLKSTGDRHSTGVPVMAAQIVPPPPQVPGTANSNRWSPDSTAIPVVPPPPSVGGVKNTLRYAKLLSAGTPQVVPPVLRTGGKSAGGEGPIGLSADPATQSATEDIGGKGMSADPKELSLAFIGPVLPLPSSSYFSSSEIFVAEERLSSHHKRLIKLVYDFLPYQRRLSDYGPNYPEVEKLRVTRDVTCDETLLQAASSASTSGASGADRALLDSQYTQQQTKLPCFRTTADDYRRARIHPRK
jgi:hypothetical protein